MAELLYELKGPIYKLTIPVAVVAKFPGELNYEDWKYLREDFYQKFPISFLEIISKDMVLAIVQKEKYESVRVYFKISDIILSDANIFATLEK